MFFKNSKNEYLTEGLKLTKNRENASLLSEEMVSCKITRFKIGEKYIGCVSDMAFFTEKSDDSSIFIYDKVKSKYYTIGGMVLTLSFKGLCCKEVSKEDCKEDNDLSIEYISEEEIIYLQFKRNGLVTWKGDTEKIEEARNEILKEKHTRISNLFYNEIFIDFLKNQTMKFLLDRIYEGEGKYHLTTYSSNTLRKGDEDKRFFHVDYPYHNIEGTYPDAILGIQVIFALDDFTLENGATMYIPNSYNMHRFPNLNLIKEKDIKYITVKKGEIIFYRGDMWHSQGINLTDNPRVAILANFSPLNIPAKDDLLSHISKSFSLKIKEGKVLI